MNNQDNPYQNLDEANVMTEKELNESLGGACKQNCKSCNDGCKSCKDGGKNADAPSVPVS